jgi:uncharacterized membrane protein
MAQMNKHVKTIVVIGALSALIIVLGLTNLGFIPWFSGASITILHIPVIIAAVLEGLVPGCIVGAVFGIFSMIRAITSPTGPIDVFFKNPLVSVLPRILFAVAAYFIFIGFFKLLGQKRKSNRVIAAGLAAFLSTLAHTVFVISALYIINRNEITQLFEGNGCFVTLGALMPQSVLEAVAALIFTVAVVLVIYGSSKRKSAINSADEE